MKQLSLKEVFEKVIMLQGQLEIMEKENLKTNKQFKFYVYWLFFLSIANIIIHSLVMFK